MLRRDRDDDRAVSQTVAAVLLVAIVVVLATIVGTMAFGFLDGLGAPTAEASFEFGESPAGLTITPRAIGEAVEVRINGETVTRFEPDEAGETKLVPTARGDTVTIVSTEGDLSVLLEKQIDERSESGDLVAYYTFDSGGDTVVDRSGNGNEGTLQNDPTWITENGRTGLAFDGDDDHVTVDDLSTGVGDVDAFTVAVTYRVEASTGDTQQLIEHHAASDSEWYLETENHGSDSYELEYSVDHTGNEFVRTGDLEHDETHVAVGTYDGSSFSLYLDGSEVADDSFSQPVEMGDLVIGADAPDGNSQFLDGRVYQIRLYYTALDPEAVASLTRAMEREAE